MKRLLIAILFLFVAPVVAKADLKDVSKATCKVYSDEGTGTGVVFLRVPAADAPATLSVTPGTNSVATLGPGDKVCTFTVSGTVVF